MHLLFIVLLLKKRGGREGRSAEKYELNTLLGKVDFLTGTLDRGGGVFVLDAVGQAMIHTGDRVPKKETPGVIQCGHPPNTLFDARASGGPNSTLKSLTLPRGCGLGVSVAANITATDMVELREKRKDNVFPFARERRNDY